MADWYYAEGDKQAGPVSDTYLKECLQRGQLDPSTLVWHESMKDWTPASRVPHLMDSRPAAPPLVEGAPAYGATPAYGAATAHAAAPAGYAGFWKRFAAFIIDRILLFGVGMFVGAIFGFIYALSNPDPDMGNLQLYAYCIGVFINFLYFTFFESSALQATLGKKALGIIVTDLDGNRIGYARAVGRYFASFFSYVTLLVGFMMAGFTERKQALHDMIAGCLVVNKV